MAVKAGEAFVQILADSSKLKQGLKKASAQLKSFGASATKIGLQVAGIGLALAAPFILATKVFLQVGDALEKMSRRTGIAVEALSALGFAAEQSGSDLATLEKGVRSMQRAINDLGRGLSTQKDAFAELGLTFKILEKLTPEEQFTLIADQLSKIEDPTKRAAVALQIFGRAGSQLLPLLEDGAQGIEKLIKEAQRLGIVVTGEEAKAAAEFTDEINILRRTFERLLFVVGGSVLPVFRELRNTFLGVVQTLIIIIKNNKSLLQTILKLALGAVLVGSAVAAFGITVTVLGIAIGAVASIVGAFTAILGILFTAISFLLTPFGLITAAVVAFGVSLIIQFDLVRKGIRFLLDGVERLKTSFGAAFKEIIDRVKKGDLEGAFKILTATLNVIWVKVLGELKKAWAELNLFIVNLVVSKIQMVWNDLIIGLAVVLLKFKDKAKDIFEDITTFTAQVFIELGLGSEEDKRKSIQALEDRNRAEKQARQDKRKEDIKALLGLSSMEQEEIRKNKELREKLARDLLMIAAIQIGVSIDQQEVSDTSKKAQADLDKAKKRTCRYYK